MKTEKVQAEKKQEFTARSGRANSRQTIQILLAIVIGLIGLSFFLGHKLQVAYEAFAERPYLVFHDKCGKTDVSDVSQYRTGASAEEVKGKAWDVVRLIAGADDTTLTGYFNEVERMMDDATLAQFKNDRTALENQIKTSGAFSRLAVKDIRKITREDLPPNSKERITDYDVIVTGMMTMFDKTTSQPFPSLPQAQNPGEFSYRVTFVPAQARSITNPSGLILTGFRKFTSARPVVAAPTASPEASPVQ